jgi:hypothetical protein
MAVNMKRCAPETCILIGNWIRFYTIRQTLKANFPVTNILTSNKTNNSVGNIFLSVSDDVYILRYA